MPGSQQKVLGGRPVIAQNRVVLILAACLASCVLLLNYTLERQFDDLGVLDQYNVLFDSDPNARLEAFSNGDESGRNVAHPNLSNFLNLPIRILGKGLCLIGLTDRPEPEVRRSISMLVMPVASAVGVFWISWFFWRLGFSLLGVTMLTVLHIVAFSQVIFGSIPEHFALGGLCIIIMFWLALDLIKTGGKLRWRPWLAVGVLTMGITITNLMIVGILLGTSLILTKRQFLKPLAHTAVILASIAAINAGIMYTVNTAFDLDMESREASSAWVTKFFHKEKPLSRFAGSPNALANAISPPGFGTTDNEAARIKSSKYQFRFTLNETPPILSDQNILGSATFLFMLAGAVRCFAAGGAYRTLVVASALIILYNLLFHAIWGVEYFLYSQHWHFSGLVCLSGMMSAKGRLGQAAQGVLAVFVVCVAVNNGVRIYQMLAFLRASG